MPFRNTGWTFSFIKDGGNVVNLFKDLQVAFAVEVINFFESLYKIFGQIIQDIVFFEFKIDGRNNQMVTAKLNEVFQIFFFLRYRDSIFQKRDGILCTREQFNDFFPELGMFIEREAMTGKIEEFFVGHEGKVFSVQCSVAGYGLRVGWDCFVLRPRNDALKEGIASSFVLAMTR